jgi:uncharacterized protein (TIGR04255 family)
MDRTSSAPWKKPPLVYVVVQLVFGPVEKMEDFVPAIQEGLRQWYPRFTARINEVVQVNPAQRTVQLEQARQWVFQDAQMLSAVVLQKNSLAFEVWSYKSFHSLSSDFLRVINLVCSVAGINLVERLGLRYVNLLGEDSLPLVHQFSSGVQGIFQDPHRGISSKIIQFVENCSTPIGGLTLRYVKIHQDIQFDINAFLTPPKHLNHLVDRKPPLVILDIDHFKVFSPEESAPLMSQEELATLLTSLHGEVSEAFHRSLTEAALQLYKDGIIPSLGDNGTS